MEALKKASVYKSLKKAHLKIIHVGPEISQLNPMSRLKSDFAS